VASRPEFITLSGRRRVTGIELLAATSVMIGLRTAARLAPGPSKKLEIYTLQVAGLPENTFAWGRMTFFQDARKKLMTETTGIAGRLELEAALERANLDVRVATMRYDQAKQNTLAWRRNHPTLDSIKIINNVAYTSVNASLASHSALNELCSREAKAQRKFSEALRMRADLLRELKRI